jgi:hypothetical protein
MENKIQKKDSQISFLTIMIRKKVNGRKKKNKKVGQKIGHFVQIFPKS